MARWAISCFELPFSSSPFHCIPTCPGARLSDGHQTGKLGPTFRPPRGSRIFVQYHFCAVKYVFFFEGARFVRSSLYSPQVVRLFGRCSVGGLNYFGGGVTTPSPLMSKHLWMCKRGVCLVIKKLINQPARHPVRRLGLGGRCWWGIGRCGPTHQPAFSVHMICMHPTGRWRGEGGQTWGRGGVKHGWGGVKPGGGGVKPGGGAVIHRGRGVSNMGRQLPE